MRAPTSNLLCELQQRMQTKFVSSFSSTQDNSYCH